jgi:hypothetical protein
MVKLLPPPGQQVQQLFISFEGSQGVGMGLDGEGL